MFKIPRGKKTSLKFTPNIKAEAGFVYKNDTSMFLFKRN